MGCLSYFILGSDQLLLLGTVVGQVELLAAPPRLEIPPHLWSGGCEMA